MANRIGNSEIQLVSRVVCMVLATVSISSAQQDDIPRSGIPYKRVFVPSNDLGSLGLDDFSPIEVNRLEELLQKYSESYPTEAVGEIGSDFAERAQLNSTYYVAKLVGADLLSERSRMTFAGSSHPGERVTLRPWSLAIQPLDNVSAGSGTQSTPNLIFDEQGSPQAALMPSEIWWSTERSVRQQEFPCVFGWSARAESASTPNKLKFSFEIPTCANSCLVLALPPQAVVHDCLTSSRRVEKWTDIKLRLVGWDDFGMENLREQTDSRSRESLWLIELGGRQVVSFSIALGVGIRAQDDTRESEVHRYRQLIRSQNLEHFVEGQEIRTTCEAEVNLSQEPSPMRMSLSPASRLLRLFVDQQEVDWKVDNGWIQWSTAPFLPGATSTGRVRIFADARLPFPVLIKGNVDRIELRNGKIRIVDYKTGKVDKNHMILKSWNGLTEDIKNDKIIQVLAYAFMYEEQAKGQEMEAGIISFKNLKTGFLPFKFRPEKDVDQFISAEIMENYLEQIVILLQEILNQDIPFEEKVV